jgi:glutaredoxin
MADGGREEPAAARDVVVYTTPFCVPCDALKRFLSAHDVPFRVRDLLMDEDAQDRLEAARIRSTPVLEIDGELHVGEALAPENVKRLLGI